MANHLSISTAPSLDNAEFVVQVRQKNFTCFKTLLSNYADAFSVMRIVKTERNFIK